MAKMSMKKLFKGKDTKAEEMKEAKAVRSGKITPAQYTKGEKMEGTKKPASALMKRGQAMKSGKMSPAAYAKGQMKKGR